MSAHRHHTTHDSAWNKDTIKDPEDAGTIKVTKSGYCAFVSGAGAETRTMPAPLAIGQRIILALKTDGGGDITLTVTGGYNQGGETSMLFSDAGDAAGFIAIESGSNLRWRLDWSEGVNALIATSALWELAPAPTQNPFLYSEFYEDFKYEAPIDANLRWLEFDDGTTGTNVLADAANGVGNLVTGAVDNDYHGIGSRAESWLFAAGKKMWFEARIKLTEAATNDSAWWVGLTDTLTTGGLQADANGPLASYDGALIWKDEDTMLVDFETSNAGTQATTTNMGTFVSGTWTRVGFYFDGTATTSIITPYFNLDDTAGMTAGTPQDIVLSGLEEMHLVLGVKAGPGGGAETLLVDYVKCVQLR